MTRWLADDEQQVWRDYLEVTRVLLERLHRQLADEADMSFPEYEVLVALSEAPGRTLRMAQLAAVALSSRSRLTHTVSRMEVRGLVQRSPCPDDGRGVQCTLTDAGWQRLVAVAPGHVEEVRRALFDPLDAEEVEALGAALATIRASLREHPFRG